MSSKQINKPKKGVKKTRRPVRKVAGRRSRTRPMPKQMSQAPGYITSVPGAVMNQVPRSYTEITKHVDSKNGVHEAVKLRFGGVVAIMNPSVTFVRTCTASTVGSTGTFAGTLYLPLHPSSLPRTAVNRIYDTYTRFQFKRVRMSYYGNADTAQRAKGSLCYHPDGASYNLSPTYTDAVTYPAFVPYAAWNSASMDVTPLLNTKDWFYTDFQDGIIADSDLRQGYQGMLYSTFDNYWSTQANDSFGYLWLEGEVILAEPNSFKSNFSAEGPYIIPHLIPEAKRRQVGQRIREEMKQKLDSEIEDEDYVKPSVVIPQPAQHAKSASRK
jgi:hypothetical protein